jgi:hypothetical protein
MIEKNDMVKKQSWDCFRNAGLLWWINRILHTFGWAIVTEVNEEGEVTDAYPARVKFRGFHLESEERGFKRVSQHMVENAEELLKEAEEE